MIHNCSLREWEEAISTHVKMLFESYNKADLLYHNYQHTLKVVARTKEIAAEYILDETEKFVLYAAAWFHDTGQLFTRPEFHEAKSVNMMRDYFSKYGLPASTIAAIDNCIFATKIPHRPATLLQEILCDADTFNLGTDEFFETDKLLKEELEMRGLPYTANWDRNTLEFMEEHIYFTSYCKKMLNKGKRKNISWVKIKIISDYLS